VLGHRFVIGGELLVELLGLVCRDLDADAFKDFDNVLHILTFLSA